jgi:hypothetical protein
MNNTPCRECGDPIEDSVGEAAGFCQKCWERSCSAEWWRMMNQSTEVIAGG